MYLDDLIMKFKVYVWRVETTMKKFKCDKSVFFAIFGISFFLLVSFTKTSLFSEMVARENSVFNGNYLESSEVSGKIHIVGSSGWADARARGICTGLGSSSNPYRIEDKVIDGKGTGTCIWIEDSNKYFII